MTPTVATLYQSLPAAVRQGLGRAIRGPVEPAGVLPAPIELAGLTGIESETEPDGRQYVRFRFAAIGATVGIRNDTGQPLRLPSRPGLTPLPGSRPGVRLTRPPEAIPDDFNVDQERRRLRSGGCCGPPSTSQD